MEGIKTKKIIVADDIASAKEAEKESKRRGIAGMIFVFKVAGAVAETGASLDETFKVATVKQIIILELLVLHYLLVFYLKLENLLLKLMMMKLK